jgi:hypothetical protein
VLVAFYLLAKEIQSHPATCLLASWRKEELIKNLNLSHVGATTVFYLPFGWM